MMTSSKLVGCSTSRVMEMTLSGLALYSFLAGDHTEAGINFSSPTARKSARRNFSVRSSARLHTRTPCDDPGLSPAIVWIGYDLMCLRQKAQRARGARDGKSEAVDFS
jgi:hypothetical protein